MKLVINVEYLKDFLMTNTYRLYVIPSYNEDQPNKDWEDESFDSLGLGFGDFSGDSHELAVEYFCKKIEESGKEIRSVNKSFQYNQGKLVPISCSIEFRPAMEINGFTFDCVSVE